MRAVVLHGREDLRVEEVPETAPGRGEVRVRIGAALTCGTDLKVYRRGYHARMLTPPCRFGHEFAGTIDAVGPGVTGWSEGDRVVAANSAPCGACRCCRAGRENLCDDLLFLNGAYAESIVVPSRIVERNLLRIPPGVGEAAAALTEPLACVELGVDELRLRGGERLLVLGSGPIALMAVALGRAAGAEVTLVGRGERRLAVARRLGASAVLENRASEGVDAPGLEEDAFDAVFEAVGKPSVWEATLRLVAKGGRVNLFGGCPSGTMARFDTGRLHYSSITLLASFHHTPQTIRKALADVASGVVPSGEFIDATAPLESVPELFRSMAAGNAAVKTGIRTSGD